MEQTRGHVTTDLVLRQRINWNESNDEKGTEE